MEILYDLLFTEGTRWCVMALLIFAITFLFKYPYKKFFTDKIKDETKRKIANKVIVLFTIVLGVVLEIIWCYIRGWDFTVVEFGYGLRQGLSAIALYSALEVKTKGKVENPFNNEDSQEVIQEITEFVEKQTSKTKETKKQKENNKKKSKETAEQKFWSLVGQDNEN